MGLQKTNEYIFPIFLLFLRDENLEIRISLLNTIDKLNEVD